MQRTHQSALQATLACSLEKEKIIIDKNNELQKTVEAKQKTVEAKDYEITVLKASLQEKEEQISKLEERCAIFDSAIRYLYTNMALENIFLIIG